MHLTTQWLPRRGRICLDPDNRLPIKDFFNKPEHFCTYEQAKVIADDQSNSCDGVGFVLLQDDPYFFIDLDNQFNDGQWSLLSQDICTRFAGARIELSQSRTGLHIYGRASSIPRHGCTNKSLGIEMYSSSRFVNVTEIEPQGDSEFDCTDALHWLIETYLPPRDLSQGAEWSDQPREDWAGYEDNQELLAHARAAVGAAGVFGSDKCTFGDLWSRREEKLTKQYPHPDDDSIYDASAADMALAQHLAFWTGCNAERMHTLMHLSSLERSKWIERPEYLQMTILNAIGMQVDVHRKRGSETADVVEPEPVETPSVPAPPPIEEETLKTNGKRLRTGEQVMMVTQQLSYFDRCVYVRSIDKVLIPGGELLNRSRFDASFGGYQFSLDSGGEKTTKSAWEAFTASWAIDWPKVKSLAFRPTMEPGEVFTEHGDERVNSYYPPVIARKVGDPTPFINHVRRLLPDERDFQLILAYMAACVQHPGVKFQWCPLIQGVEGNGKTLLTRVVSEAVGLQFFHAPLAQDIDNVFNAWMTGKIFIGIEDIYVSEDRGDVIEALKPMITNELLQVTSKGVDQVTADICCNFIVNSNHKDAIRKTRNDRRWAIFFTAQQDASDIDRDGMGGDYFRDLYDWLKGEGYSIVSEFLHTYSIPDEMNPATSLQRAPVTSSTEEALTLALGSIEQIIQEAIDEGRQGFAGGWVSSFALDRLLGEIGGRRKIPVSKRRALMRTLGYDYHPGLPDGRLTTPSDIDGNTRPKLFVVEGSDHTQLTDTTEILHTYRAAQNHINPFGVK